MNVKRSLAIALIAMSFGGGSAQAQNVSSVQAPAEFPPASYTGRQYVDSNGCVFVRAGIDGNVSWIPRVSRNRKVICGFQPSLPGNAGKAVVAAQPAQEPVQITVAPEPATKPAAAPATAEPVAVVSVAKPKGQAAQVQPVPEPVALAQPKPKVQPKPQPQPQVVMVTPQPQPVPMAQPTIVRIKPAPQPAVKPVPKTVTIATAKPAPKASSMAPRQSTCRGASAISSQYLKAPRGLEVRCGPQATSHVSVINGGNGRSLVRSVPVPTATMVTAGTTQTTTYIQPVPLKRAAAAPTANSTFVPEHVYRDQVNSTVGVYIPKGYKATWEDDRLNPKRAHQTFAGKAQMELRWTNTVPRRLVEAKTGKEVRYLYPDLQYPNTSYGTQVVAGVSASSSKAQASTVATVSTKGVVPEQPVRRKTALTSREAMETKASKRSAKRKPVVAGVSATVSTRSSTVQPKAKTQPKAATKVRTSTTHRYVQVGLFGEPGNAERAAQRLANAGLPARMGKSGRYKVVVAGPFSSQGQLTAALQKVRSMGFSDAYLRK